MVFDPEFGEIGPDKRPRAKTRWSWVRQLLLYPLLGFAGCHTLMTGSPIPLWYTERLNHPVEVKELTDRALVLADGRRVGLPFIKRVPRNDPVFLLALKRGVEVDENHEVSGLLTIYRTCGNDACLWYTKRINLSDLAGLMDPDAIDETIVHPDEIKDLKERKSENTYLDRHGLPYLVFSKARKMRSLYRFHSDRVKGKSDLP